MISKALAILFIIGLFPVLQIPPKVMAQAPPPSEAAKVLVDDAIHDLKSNDTKKAQVHLVILNQQLPALVNSSSIQPVVKVLVDDATSALKNGDINKAIVHLALIPFHGQFYGPTGIAVDPAGNVYVADMLNNRIQKFDSSDNFITKWGSRGTGDGEFDHPNAVAVDSKSGNVYVGDFDKNNRIQVFAPSTKISNVQTNHPPTADNLTITIKTKQPSPIKLKGNDAHGDVLTYSIVSDPSPSGSLSKLESTRGEVFYSPPEGCTTCYSTFQYRVTDSRPLGFPQ